MSAAPLSSRCEVCGAGAGVECADVIPGQLSGRRFHLGRTDDTAVQFVPRDSARPYDPPALTESAQKVENAPVDGVNGRMAFPAKNGDAA